MKSKLLDIFVNRHEDLEKVIPEKFSS